MFGVSRSRSKHSTSVLCCFYCGSGSCSAHLVIRIFSNSSRVNSRKKSDSSTSILLRILTNYIQIMTSAAAYNLDYPQYLLDYFKHATIVGNTSEQLISIDCFLKGKVDTGSSSFLSSVFFYRVFFTSFIPIVLVLAVLLGMAIISFTFFKGANFFKKRFVLSIIVTLYLIHPSITITTFRTMNCIDVEGKSYLIDDTDTLCWGSSHTTCKSMYLMSCQSLSLWRYQCYCFGCLGCLSLHSLSLLKIERSLKQRSRNQSTEF